tara:strand:- start:90 stop:422 length:333 start_codon:yes stop_codon:yes gene_type:complete
MWGPRFPVDVRQIALEYSKRFSDPVLDIIEAPVPSFEGALAPLKKRGGWAILYNPGIRSAGRINYTLGTNGDITFVTASKRPQDSSVVRATCWADRGSRSGRQISSHPIC